MTYYTVYKTTNKVNGKIYIGSHKTNNLNDTYLGSGKYLNYAVKKYGRAAFSKEILFVFDAAELMYAKEADLVSELFVKDKATYNLKRGGNGGFDYINSTGKNLYGSNGRTPNVPLDLQRGRETNLRLNAMFPERKLQIAKKISKAKKGMVSTFVGKNHSEEAKAKIGAKNAVKQAGSGNSQFGKIWIYSETEMKSIKINKTDDIPSGWHLGRKMKF